MNQTKIFFLHTKLKLSKCFNKWHTFNITNTSTKLNKSSSYYSNKQNHLTSIIHISGSALSSSTDIRATRSTHSCIASVICGTTKIKISHLNIGYLIHLEQFFQDNLHDVLYRLHIDKFYPFLYYYHDVRLHQEIFRNYLSLNPLH